jgi:ribonucleoside-diphosphate reductase alpha chain
MRIVKRDGRIQECNFDKITARIRNECESIEGTSVLDPSTIAQKVITFVKDNIHTSEIDEVTARVLSGMSTIHPDYTKLASRIIMSNHHKNTLGCFSDKIEKLYKNRDSQMKLHSLVSRGIYNLTMKYKNQLNKIIDYERDFLIDYFGFKTLERSYLLKIHGVGIIERPQDLFLRVSLALHQDDLENVKKSYDLMSLKYFTHATPTLFNAGTQRPQLSSCFLLGIDDSITSIFKCLSDCAQISKWSGGIGIGISDIRANNSLIKGTNGKTNGLIPMLRVFNETALYVNQGGKRNGSIALYLEPHHPDFLDFLDIRKNSGDEMRRARDLFTAVWTSDLFLERVKNNETWSFMCPDTCTGLSDAYGQEYVDLYTHYEEQKMYTSQMPARDVWKAIITSQIETGTPYMSNKDAANLCSNQKNIGTIKNSNLCNEVYEVSNTKEYAVCTLASVCLPKFVKDGVFDYQELIQVVSQMTINLNKVIDLNYYPVKETKTSNSKHRPIGIGVQGLADTYLSMKMAYDSDEAKELNKRIFETIYYASVQESCNLAKQYGVYDTFEGSPISQGKFQFDLWKDRGFNVELSGMYDWETLRTNVMTHGVRNSLLIALMPTASTSQIMGNTEAFEPITSNIYTRKTIAGDFIIVNKFLMNELIELGLWDESIKDTIIRNNGSVQSIEQIPADIRARYKTVWELKQKVLIDQSADRAPFVCQSQSLNLYFSKPQFQTIHSALMYGYSRGLKTMSYYTRTQAMSEAVAFTVNEPNCESCSG